MRAGEFELARVSKRAELWSNAEHVGDAIGKLIYSWIVFRGSCASSGRYRNFKSVTQRAVLEYLSKKLGSNLTYPAFNNFLNGRPTDPDSAHWEEFGQHALHFILLGENCPGSGRTPTDRAKDRELADRIIDFYFRTQNNVGRSFLDRTLKNISFPASRRDAIAEMRSIAYLCSPLVPDQYKGLILRVSGFARFLQVKDTSNTAELTESGHATIEAILDGAIAAFVVPETSHRIDAIVTAQRFYDLANQAILKRLTRTNRQKTIEALARIRIIPVPSGEWKQGVHDNKEFLSFGGAWLNSTFRFIYHRCESAIAGPKGWSRLLVARDPKYGAAVFEGDEEEKRSFRQWLALFVDQDLEPNDPERLARATLIVDRALPPQANAIATQQ